MSQRGPKEGPKRAQRGPKEGPKSRSNPSSSHLACHLFGGAQGRKGVSKREGSKFSASLFGALPESMAGVRPADR